jgi:hypothetical protein
MNLHVPWLWILECNLRVARMQVFGREDDTVADGSNSVKWTAFMVVQIQRQDCKDDFSNNGLISRLYSNDDPKS